jgi:sulfopyruvate decarboxylase alpha subunit
MSVENWGVKESRVTSGPVIPIGGFAFLAERRIRSGGRARRMATLPHWLHRPDDRAHSLRLVTGDRRSATAADWPSAVHGILAAAHVRQVAVVPDAGLSRLLALCETDRTMRVVRLTTEEEGVALLAGAWLGGDKGILLMQSSGTGNCVNMLALPVACRFPLLMLVTMRGEPGESNPAQLPMGGATGRVLEAIGVHVTRAERADDVPGLLSAALERAYATESPQAVLIAQRALGFKEFK